MCCNTSCDAGRAIVLSSGKTSFAKLPASIFSHRSAAISNFMGKLISAEHQFWTTSVFAVFRCWSRIRLRTQKYRWVPLNPNKQHQEELFRIEQNLNQAGRIALWRLRCSFHRILNCLGILIIHIRIKWEIPVLLCTGYTRIVTLLLPLLLCSCWSFSGPFVPEGYRNEHTIYSGLNPLCLVVHLAQWSHSLAEVHLSSNDDPDCW